MRNEDCLLGVYAPYALPAGIIIPERVQDFIRARMVEDAKAAGIEPKAWVSKTDSKTRPRKYDRERVLSLLAQGHSVAEVHKLTGTPRDIINYYRRVSEASA